MRRSLAMSYGRGGRSTERDLCSQGIWSEQGEPDLLVGQLKPLEGRGERGEAPMLVEVLLSVQGRRLFEGTNVVTVAAA